MTTFTILIAIRNAAAELRATLDSLDAQTSRDFEVIIADCNSTDNPAQLLQDRPYPVQHVVQSDTGIYDSWNKVLPLARGDWVIFMGAGDTFKTAQTLDAAATALGQLPPDVLMAYGRVDVLGENGKFVGNCGAPWPEALDQIRRFDMFPHQATFQRVSTFAQYGLFDPSYRIAGDTDMILRLAAIRDPLYIKLVVANFQFGGASSVPAKRLTTVREMSRVLRTHGLKNKAWWIFPKAIVMDTLNRLLSDVALMRLIDCYRVMTLRPKRFR